MHCHLAMSIFPALILEVLFSNAASYDQVIGMEVVPSRSPNLGEGLAQMRNDYLHGLLS